MYENKEGSDNYFDYLEANVEFLISALEENDKIGGMSEENNADYLDFLAGNGM